MMIETDSTVTKMTKEGNMEIKKRFIYINPLIRSGTYVAFSLCSPSAFLRYIFWLVFCFLHSKICFVSF